MRSLKKRLKDWRLSLRDLVNRRVHALLRRDGLTINRKRVERIWDKFGLQVPARTQKKKRVKTHGSQPTPQACRPNEVWTYDFVFDRDAAGRKLKMLTVMDEFTREGLAIRVGRSFKSVQVKAVLAEVGAKRGFPKFLRSDNGSEFIAEIIKEYLGENKIEAAFIRTGKSVAEWQKRKFQRQIQKRVFENGRVWKPARGGGHRRELAQILQHRKTAF